MPVTLYPLAQLGSTLQVEEDGWHEVEVQPCSPAALDVGLWVVQAHGLRGDGSFSFFLVRRSPRVGAWPRPRSEHSWGRYNNNSTVMLKFVAGHPGHVNRLHSSLVFRYKGMYDEEHEDIFKRALTEAAATASRYICTVSDEQGFDIYTQLCLCTERYHVQSSSV